MDRNFSLHFMRNPYNSDKWAPDANQFKLFVVAFCFVLYWGMNHTQQCSRLTPGFVLRGPYIFRAYSWLCIMNYGTWETI